MAAIRRREAPNGMIPTFLFLLTVVIVVVVASAILALLEAENFAIAAVAGIGSAALIALFRYWPFRKHED